MQKAVNFVLSVRVLFGTLAYIYLLCLELHEEGRVCKVVIEYGISLFEYPHALHRDKLRITGTEAYKCDLAIAFADINL